MIGSGAIGATCGILRLMETFKNVGKTKVSEGFLVAKHGHRFPAKGPWQEKNNPGFGGRGPAETSSMRVI